MNVAFYIFACIAVVSSIMLILHRNVLISAMFLLLVLLSTAIIFILLNAQLVAFLQIILYAGAVVVLFVITINLVQLKEEAINLIKLSFIKVLSVPLVIVFIWQLIQIGRAYRGVKLPDVLTVGGVELIAEAIFKKFVLQFELMSLLLLLGIVGAIILAKRRI
jgi:NADH-quinone oxidoreductase subunit J